MAKYIVEEKKNSKYEKNYQMPMINILPGIVWSVPLHQKLFPNTNGWVSVGLCVLFILFYITYIYIQNALRFAMRNLELLHERAYALSD